MKQAVRYLAYPLTMLLAFAVFIGLAGHAPLLVRTFASVLVAAAAVIVLEAYIPYRREWQPGINDFLNDGSYAVLVQILLPKVLTIGFLLLLALQFQRMDGIWPHRWPVFAQVLLMIMISDFLRYWLHRFFHTFPVLWRLHEVHHSPDHLYWLNASRFHPVEKTVQYLVDGLPYVMLGISPDVLAAFFVFYEVNGFYQHGNMDARFGLLNYLISGPELHRWHHSVEIAESNMNYGNNLIIWDQLFGTRFFPKDRSVGTLGLQKTRYPMNFLGQLLAPFRQQV